MQVVPTYGVVGNSTGHIVALLLGKIDKDFTIVLIDCILRKSFVWGCWVLRWQASSIPHHTHQLLLTNQPACTLQVSALRHCLPIITPEVSVMATAMPDSTQGGRKATGMLQQSSCC